MSNKALKVAVRLTILSAFVLNGCQHLDQPYREIVLDGFSDSNYSQLNQSIGTPVCIRGKLVVSSMGLHFALQPSEENGVLSPGYSRIVTGLNNDYALRNRIVDGRNYRVRGMLRDATPFPQCDRDDCRWYELGDSELRWDPRK
jgi:hypothetical protein